ncbi:hypothetical protein RchiOBHm_Chr3g0458871 [Rosa chinensis]|uniref:Uncharacterized protein n=1 Tax=Rosa chinensis TaxID=74649 RepID=A0A2P6R824_ROSCH|nr:hypothetical protein RchiOBHm_Chr3g0458871 [Rosa chinensis]
MMSSKFRFKPGIKHYGCQVDLFGRAGKLEKALHVTTTNMPYRYHFFPTFARMVAAHNKTSLIKEGEGGRNSIHCSLCDRFFHQTSDQPQKNVSGCRQGGACRRGHVHLKSLKNGLQNKEEDEVVLFHLTYIVANSVIHSFSAGT